MKRIVIPLAMLVIAFTGCSMIRQYDLAPDPTPPSTEVLVGDGLTAFDEATECNAATTADCPPSTGPEEINPPPSTVDDPAVGEEYNPAICVPAWTCPTIP